MSGRSLAEMVAESPGQSPRHSRSPSWSPAERGDLQLDDVRVIVRDTRTRARPRIALVVVALIAALLVASALSLSVGKFPVPLSQIPAILVGGGDPGLGFVVLDIRLPRLVCGLLVGVSLGISGAIFQSLVRNELASPDVIGITTGAGVGAVVMIVMVGGTAFELSLAALVGGLVTAAGIYFLAYKKGIAGYRLILVGIGVGAGLGAITSFLLLSADLEELRRVNIWMIGSLNGASWGQTRPVMVVLALLLPLVLLIRPVLRALQLGDDTAAGIGVRIGVAKAAILVIGVALTAFATAAAGPIAFVAFVAAPLARRLVGTGDPALYVSGLVGALLLTAADVVAKLDIADAELPVGIFTGIIGAPYLVWLLIKTNRTSTGD